MTDWKQEFIDRTLQQHGCIPAPWIYQPGCHPYSIGWRMGAGETYMTYFWDWLDEQNWSQQELAQYFLEQDLPPAWLLWVAELVLEVDEPDLDTPEEDRLNQLRPELEKMGFTGFDQFQADFDDPKWN